MIFAKQFVWCNKSIMIAIRFTPWLKAIDLNNLIVALRNDFYFAISFYLHPHGGYYFVKTLYFETCFHAPHKTKGKSYPPTP